MSNSTNLQDDFLTQINTFFESKDTLALLHLNRIRKGKGFYDVNSCFNVSLEERKSQSPDYQRYIDLGYMEYLGRKPYSYKTDAYKLTIHGASTRNAATDSTRSTDSTSTNRVNSTGGGVKTTGEGGFQLFGQGLKFQGEAGTSYYVHDGNNEDVSKSKDSSYTFSKDDNWNTSQIAEKSKQLNQIDSSNVQDSQLRSLIRNTQDSMRNAYENFSGFTATQSRERVLSETANLTESQRMNIQHRLEQEFVGYARARLGDENVGYVLTSGTAEAREQRTQLINEYAAQFEASLRNIHDGNGVKVLGSQGGFSDGNSGGQGGFKGGVSGGQVENYVGNRGFDYEEQAKKMGIKTDPIEHINPNDNRNQNVRNSYDIQAGKNRIMADDAEKFANNREKANEDKYKDKY